MKIEITVSPEASYYLNVLLLQGLHGKTREKVLENLVYAEIRQLLKDGFLRLQ